MDSVGANSWSLFLDYLQRPISDYWVTTAFLTGAGLAGRLQPAQFSATVEIIGGIAEIGHPVPVWPSLIAAGATADGLGAVFGPPQLAGAFAVTLSGMKARDPRAAFLLLHFNDDQRLSEPDFPAHWRGFLALLNRVQFLPWFNVVTTRLAKSGATAAVNSNYGRFITDGRPKAATDPIDPDQTGRLAESEMAHPLVRPLLLEIIAAHLPWPEIGYEFMPDGRTVGTAELAWLNRRVALFTATQAEESAAFIAAGWRTVTIPADAWPESDRSAFITGYLAQTQ
jgi:hypothetical protein